MNTRAADVIETLNDLIETCKDGEFGFRAAAEQAKSQSLRSTLMARAEDCRLGAEQLRSHVTQLGGEAEDGGSALGAVHRGWVAVKAKLSTYDDLAVLEECERGEDAALAAYREALDTELPAPIRNLVQTQYEGAKRNHDQVRRLRDAMKVAP
jgi:uncharacterized protein (TIGR02284 family)